MRRGPPGLIKLLTLLLATMLLSSAGTFAPSALAEDVQWRGFFTTGAAFTDNKTTYGGGIGRRLRLTEETVFGLALSKDISPEWRVGAQLLSLPGEADAAVKVDWAFATYTPREDFSVILGKQKTATFMLASFYDVGLAYPWSQPPIEIYGLFGLKALTGISVAYTYKFENSSITLHPFEGDFVSETTPSSPTVGSKYRGHNVAGASIDWTGGKNVFHMSYTRGLFDPDVGAPIPYGTRRIEIYDVGGKYEWHEWVLTAEYAEMHDLDVDRFLKISRSLAEQAKTAATPAEAAKLLAESQLKSIRLGPSMGYYALVGYHYGNFFPFVSPARDYIPLIAGTSEAQSSVDYGINYNLTAESVFKLEAKNIVVPKESKGYFDVKPKPGSSMVYHVGYSMIF